MRDRTTAEKIDFDGQVTAVTGGASGIGRGISEAFASVGADVAIVDIDPESAAEVADEIEAEYGVDAIPVETNVKEYDEAVEMVETVVDELGQLDNLVNNAGGGVSKPFFEQEPDEWQHQVDLCYFGTMNCTHAALQHFTERETGAIVNFASDSYRGNDPGLAVYGGAKAANVSFTKTIAKEVGEYGVRVNCVSPGTTDTPATHEWIAEYEEKILESYALDRIGQPEDHADAVVFLCSDAAGWITGQTLSVNGGYQRA